jgi:arsenate reductase
VSPGRILDVLFVCTGNSCRSQMAEGFLRHLAPERFRAWSAGTRPTALNPRAIEVMREAGVDISQQTSKDVAALAGRNFDCVITVCDSARQACPVFPGGGTRRHWELEDPAGAGGGEQERMAVFRRVRDQIEQHVRDFIGNFSERKPL